MYHKQYIRYYIFMRRMFRHKLFQFVFALALVTGGLLLRGNSASAAACTPPNPSYGVVSGITVNTTANGNYRVWARVQASSTSNNFLMTVDSSCYAVGGSGLTSADVGNWKWVDFGTNAQKLAHTFTTTGNHSVTLYGTGDGLLVDRVIFTLIDAQGNTCTPSNTIASDGTAGANCATPPDTEGPVTAITAPTGTSPDVTGASVAIKATASDVGSSVNNVQLTIGNLPAVAMTLSAGVYNYTWNTAGLADGAYVLKVVATDGSTNKTTVTKTVNLKNGKPDFKVVAVNKNVASPKAGNSVVFSAVIKNMGSVTSLPGNVTLKIGNTLVSTVTPTSTVLAGGVTPLTVTFPAWTAVAGNGQVATVPVDSGELIVELDDTPASNTSTLAFDVGNTVVSNPSVSITSPGASTKLSNTATLTASATDSGSTISTVQFYYGNTLIDSGTKSGNNYTASWNTKSVANGTYQLKAVATSAAGVAKTSGTVSVTVDNGQPQTLTGDADGDGKVCYEDLIILSTNWNKPGLSVADGNFDGIGKVDFDDFIILSTTWSGTC